MKKKNWYPLDNAAKIFPAVYGENRPYNFCFSAILTEVVEIDKLNIAINSILDRAPTFKTKLKRGIFWYYLEENKLPFVAKEEPCNFLGLIDFKENNDYLFAIYYREYKISLVSFHALSDGNGALAVFKEILFEYERLLGKSIETDGLIKTKLTPDTYLERDDDYNNHYKRSKIKAKRLKNIAHSDGTAFAYEGYGLITVSVDQAELKEVAKSYKSTVTEYLTGLYLYLFYINYIKGKGGKKTNAVILVPINMRKKYSSESVRNFSLFARVTHDFKEEISLEQCVDIAKRDMKEGVKEEVLDSMNYNNVKVEKNALLKITPLFLKDIVMKIAYYFVGENYQSGDISNVGLIELPKGLTELVKDIYFSISASTTSKQLLGVVGYNGKINMTFTRTFVENRFEKSFIKELTEKGLKVTVSSNNWEKKL